MSVAEPIPIPKTWTAESLVDRPADGIERELVYGALRARPMTRRNRVHSGIEAQIARLLGNWLAEQPAPRGRIHSGEAGFRLARDPETFVGIDVAYAPPELVARTDRSAKFYDGAPALAVEILSPSDQQGDIVEKVGLYLAAGSIVWVIDPDFRTVSIHRPGQSVRVLNEEETLDGESYLPGFRLRVRELFEP